MQNTCKPKILIVDDEKSLRTGTKRLLESEGCQVDAAENGNEGITLGTSIDYDIAIIDLKMPDTDGITVMREIMKIYPHTICLIATGYASYDTAIEAAKEGAFDYIPKPFSSEEILQKVKEGFYKRQLLLETEKLKKEREERFLEVAFEKTRLNTVINSISDGLLVINKQGQAVLYNPSVLKLLHLDNIIIEDYIVDKLHPEVAGQLNKILSAQQFELKSYSAQFNLNYEHKIYVEATSSPVPHPDGSLAGVVIVFKDITELKELEILKSQFVSMVSHELKSPISAVLGFLKLFSEHDIVLTEKQKQDYILRSQGRLEGLLKMINDLLDISRLEMKKIKREIQPIDISDSLHLVIELFRRELNEKEIILTINNKENIPSIYADEEEISRILINLVSNAIKYNKYRGTIDISVYSASNYVIFEIKDSGIGMKPAEKEKLFQEFFRAKNELTKSINGTGLGLSIVKRIMDFYSGKIEVESEFGKGTSLKLFFPLRNLFSKEEKEKISILNETKSNYNK